MKEIHWEKIGIQVMAILNFTLQYACLERSVLPNIRDAGTQ